MSNRFKDVLLALRASDIESHKIGRLQLQKLIYISDVLSPIWRHFSTPAAFIPYMRGPYDSAIQNTVDALAFRGLVTINNLVVQGTRQIESQYSLNLAGRTVVTRLIQNRSFADDLQLYSAIVKEIEYRDWSSIRTLVYAEPTYESAKAAGRWGRLRLDQGAKNLSLVVIDKFQRASMAKKHRPINRNQLVQIFFSFLDAYIALPQGSFSE